MIRLRLLLQLLFSLLQLTYRNSTTLLLLLTLHTPPIDAHGYNNIPHSEHLWTPVNTRKKSRAMTVMWRSPSDFLWQTGTRGQKRHNMGAREYPCTSACTTVMDTDRLPGNAVDTTRIGIPNTERPSIKTAPHIIVHGCP